MRGRTLGAILGVFLAALTTALLRLSGRHDTAVVAVVGDGEPFPVRLAATDEDGHATTQDFFLRPSFVLR